MEKQFFIGITGTNCSGKTSILGALLESHEFVPYSISDEIVAHAKNEFEIMLQDRDEIREYANKIRADKGGDFFLKLCVEKARQQKNHSAVFESIRTRDEVAYLKKEKILFLAIDAPPFLRLKWMKERNSLKDTVSPLELVRQEAAETYPERWKQNLPAVIEMADRRFYNNGTREELEKTIQNYLYSLPSFLPRMIKLNRIG